MTQVLAVNHAGWNVERLYDKVGWKALSGPWPDKDVAILCCEGVQKAIPGAEFRVYEALTEKAA